MNRITSSYSGPSTNTWSYWSYLVLHVGMGLDRMDDPCCWGCLVNALDRGWNWSCTLLWQHHNISREAIRERLPPQSFSLSRMPGG